MCPILLLLFMFAALPPLTFRNPAALQMHHDSAAASRLTVEYLQTTGFTEYTDMSGNIAEYTDMSGNVGRAEEYTDMSGGGGGGGWRVGRGRRVGGEQEYEQILGDARPRPRTAVPAPAGSM